MLTKIDQKSSWRWSLLKVLVNWIQKSCGQFFVKTMKNKLKTNQIQIIRS